MKSNPYFLLTAIDQATMLYQPMENGPIIQSNSLGIDSFSEQQIVSSLPLFNLNHFFLSLKSGLLLLFLAVTFNLAADQFLNDKIERLIRSQDGLNNSIWFWGAASLANSIFIPLIATLMCCFFITERIRGERTLAVFGFIRTHFEQTILESIRAWGFTFFWFFALIVPALLKYFTYFLTPFVVIYSKTYSLGSVDALKESQRVSKSHFLKLFFLVLAFYFLFPFIIAATLDEFRLFQKNPTTALLIALLDTLFIFVFHFLILKLFLRSITLTFSDREITRSQNGVNV